MTARSMGASRAVLVFTLGSLAATAAVVACAESDPETTSLAPDAQIIESPDVAEPSMDAAVDVDASDGGCESLDPAICNPVTNPCEDVDWCPANNPADSTRALTSIWGTSKNDVWAVGSYGTVIHYDGTAWKLASVDSPRTLYSVSGTGPNDVWIVGTYGSVYHGPFEDAGATTWELAPIVPYKGAAEKTLSNVFMTSADDVWVTGESLKIATATKAATQYRKTIIDGGVGWEAISPCSSCKFMSAVWGASSDDLWSVGSGGKTFHLVGIPSDDAGPADAGGSAVAGWIGVDAQTTQDLLGLWGSSKDDVWTVGRRGTIRHWEKDAQTWEVIASATTQDLHGIWGTGKDDIWAVGDYGTIVHYDGTSWNTSTASLDVGVKPNLYGVWGSAKDDVWIGGEGIVLHFTGAKK